MKILMVTMSMNIGGAETHILELCRELVSRGAEVTLASFGGVYADELKKFGVKMEHLPLNTKNPKAVMQCYRALKKLILRERFDVVHAHARIPAFICGLLWDGLRLDGYKFRFVTTAHLDFEVNPLWRKISRWGERVMAVSDDIADYLVREYGYPKGKIHRTINGIDTVKFSPETKFDGILEKYSLSRGRRRLVYMSRLDEDRSAAAFTLLGIAKSLGEKYPDLDILIVGGGGDLPKIRELADQVNSEIGRKLVTVTGAVSNTNEFCAASDVFIGVSRSALEAMSAAKPVIVAGNQGALGVFDESKSAAAVLTNFCCRGYPMADGESLYNDVTRLLDMDATELEKIGNFNRDFILENYTVSRMTDDYMEMYDTLVKSPMPFFGKPDVVISGYYGFGNLGDESLLDVITSSVSESYPGIKIAALTKNPRVDGKRTGLKCVSRFNLPSVASMLAGSKLLISGGGSLFQDSTSHRSLGYYAGVIKMAKLLGCKTFVFANGIGPIGHESNKKLTAQVVNSADSVSVRDGDSRRELVAIGVPEKKVRLSADPAFMIKPASDHDTETLKAKLGIHGGYFVLSVRPLNVRAGVAAGDDEASEAIVRKTAEACVGINREMGLMPVIVPMQLSADLDICRRVAEKIHESGVGSVIYEADSAPMLMGILAGAEFTVGMRLHMIIFASTVGCPVIGLSYDPKVSSMMNELGQEYCAELKKDSAEVDLADDILSFAKKIEGGRDEIRALLHQRSEEMKKLCETDIKEIEKLI